MEYEEKCYHRTLFLFGTLLIIFGIFGLRLCWIQIFNFSKYAKLAAKQHSFLLQKNQLRGVLHDRNGKILRGPVSKWYLLIKNSSPHCIEELKKILVNELSPNLSQEFDLNCTKPYWICSKPLSQSEINRILQLNLGEIKIIASKNGRAEPNQLAWHVLGTITGEKAQSGLEYSLEPVLKQRRFATSVNALTDGLHQSLPGLGFRFEDYPNPNGYYLTIDLEIQKAVERIMDRNGFCGAVVVLDAKNAEILAMASRPMVNLTDPAESLQDPDYPFLNRAIASYPPGSVFKIVVVSAALDSGLVANDDLFMDRGFYQIGEKRWHCTTSAGNGHGLVSLTEAFAYSCNPVFIELALRIDPRLVLDYGEKFGLGRPTNIGLVDEAWGELPTGIGLSLGERANLALGQQLISVTPLQVASMIQTVANNGVRCLPRLIIGKQYQQKKVLPLNGSGPPSRVIKVETARQVQRMMAAVLEYGTGSEAQPTCKAAGKTGTAQRGNLLPDHAWFAGYAPLNNPRYVTVVFCEKGVSGGKTAAPIFREIMDTITKRLD